MAIIYTLQCYKTTNKSNPKEKTAIGGCGKSEVSGTLVSVCNIPLIARH